MPSNSHLKSIMSIEWLQNCSVDVTMILFEGSLEWRHKQVWSHYDPFWCKISHKLQAYPNGVCCVQCSVYTCTLWIHPFIWLVIYIFILLSSRFLNWVPSFISCFLSFIKMSPNNNLHNVQCSMFNVQHFISFVQVYFVWSSNINISSSISSLISVFHKNHWILNSNVRCTYLLFAVLY